ncbi:UDP-N-acetylglucosamine 4,6-dehydratase (inverting) [Paraglaciecola agarilytica]|jgi:UDP-N-acetylglucosamine 4,6-dehydratase|uniref:UDP-glucose 4-epimerase n=1 Tax=Paraglaciecola agarilytica NO2 TaxID=1125747 RepID=A0ABQ0I801_9ALTE|nr:UDP-N-acetylglucosamine 4,6-dehydratase (inverting) [Paraglaciecola agarilytica]AEE22215.1 UDP-N-acetylglucosamine 4,6-dehydratase [Glaciecola sp. 4H-3-7+YE-5]MBU3019387.1 UDP-N-acetylglucosamine 4,6-dehydratase (inverting) [Paraglaciecola agarilytica]GAC05494.1 UDP-glucose 4-epimerase [Paraglaciecola agarilytica NO2]
MFNNKSILITGGTGSFGKRFVSFLLKHYQPQKLIIYSRDELKQFEMQQVFDAPCMRYFIGDVRDKERMISAMRDVDFVVHAAALKQVPAAEYNPNECIKTNINGAQNVIDAAIATNVSRVIALSTDKAANPVNLYGATKLASDKLFVAANNISGAKGPRFSVVRYGNVVGSRGSVVPFYRSLLEQGKTSLPVTHAEMTRFWITLDEGVEFVVRNFQRMQGGEIFVPKIPSVSILDLVESMSGTRDHDLVGIRPGEKLHEVMVPEEMAHHSLEFDDHYVITPAILFFEKNINYKRNKLGEIGKPVEEKFEYHSGTNHHFLSVEELRKLDKVTE